jgi:hypothetical protein
MTKKLFSAVLAGTAVVAVGLSATSANAATATANANAQIVSAIVINETAQLNFATIVPAADTVQVTAAGARVCGAGLTCSGTQAAGAFTATGTDGYAVNIAVSPTASLDDAGAGVAMPVSGLAPSVATATLTGGTTSFTVGGTLTVGANQLAGVYTGTYSVSVNYQ